VTILTIVIFAIAYLGIAFGRLPFLKVDRTGSALLGAIVLIVVGSIGEQAAWNSIGFETIGLLFGLMVVSSAFVVSGFYRWAATRLASLNVSSPTLLAMFILVSAVMSSVLTNDVIVVAMTPLLISITLSRGLNPVPFLLGFCFASNTGAVATVMGSPQNVIIAQALELSFSGFLGVAIVPALVSLPIVWGVLTLIYRGSWELERASVVAPSVIAMQSMPSTTRSGKSLDVYETVKAGVVTVGVVVAFLVTDYSRAQIALAAAAILLLNRRIPAKDMVGNVDGRLFLLLFGLFVLNQALSNTGLPLQLVHELRGDGVDLHNPLWLFLIASVLSNIVGNNPAAMLLMPYVESGKSVVAGVAVAFGTGFSSNMIIFGSLAGIIVVQASSAHGVRISFGQFAKAGVPVALVTMLLAAGWLWLMMHW
jgi:Na+/H+ antiporter NhaD/arsenite permease-like protein